MSNFRLKSIIAISIGLFFTIFLIMYLYPENSFAQGSLPICPVSGQINQNTTWTADCIYRVDNHVTVAANVILTVQASTIVKFAGEKALRVKGSLKVQGTANQPVTFTSLTDDTVGGDTNNDGQATLPDKGQWGHISFLNESLDSQNFIDHAIIRYGGYYVDSDYFYGGCGNCAFHGALWFFTASPTIRNTALVNNDHGFAVWNGSAPVLVCNDIYNNAGKGIYSNTPETIVVAENQWWGDASGPTHTTNPSSTGQAVGDGVDFTPVVNQFLPRDRANSYTN